MRTKRTCGIDLGTTNTTVCRFDTETLYDMYKFECLPISYPMEKAYGYNNVNGKMQLPSVLYVKKDINSPDETLHLVGRPALQQSEADNARNSSLFFNTKRMMGSSDDLGGGITSFTVAKELAEICLHSYDCNVRVDEYKVRNIDQICITRPAAFNPFAVVDTVKVLKELGCQNVVSIEEPQAALLNYLFELLGKQGKEQELMEKQRAHKGSLVFCVIDIGGGTTDVTVQKLRLSGTRKPNEAEGYQTSYSIEFQNEMQKDGKQSRSNDYAAFGGLDFDKKAADEICKLMLYEASRKDISVTNQQKEWMHAKALKEAESYKIKLSDSNGYGSYFGSFGEKFDNSSVVINYTKEQYTEWVAPLCKNDNSSSIFKNDNRCIHQYVMNTLKASGYRPDELDYVYVTGGMSQYEPVSQMLLELFPHAKISEDPMYDVCKGAALLNAYFRVTVPVVTLNKGILLDNPCGEPVQIVRSGQNLPAKDVIQGKYFMINPIQMNIDILQGNSPTDPGLSKIKTLWARRLPPTNIGTPVDIHYEINADFQINLSLHINQEGREYDIKIDSDRFDLRADQ